ncbi:MAG: lytic transglycosylase [Gammaproteobacteria bacterium]|nr:lytic transglycosylase [Gammaproteobacteria bacterium]|tara:strand:- start:712 stop:1953 length:1242 start_codon:yes stop_codon:yes gene_type:complete
MKARLFPILGCLAGLAAHPALAEEASSLVDGDAFRACVVALTEEARAAGISESVIEEVLGDVEPVERVIELDRQQPEFTQTFAGYYNRRVTTERVQRGRAMLAEHRDLLEDIQRRTGVPPHYLVAFWGLETNFGSYFGNIPVPASLTTLACDERRGRFFASELMAALRIVDAGDIPPDDMVGSWAGAMGHVQFMPSVFLRYAVDADGDGRRDLWGSVPDAMASAANFLRGIGWQPGLRWGREVRLPDGFDYALAGRDQRRPLSDWVDLGVTDAFGRALPRLDLRAALLVPSGHDGPAFLAYDNFDVIMRWNRSEFYALSVGRLADEIAGASPLRQPPPADSLRIAREDVKRLQRDLASLGFDAGEPDGIFGPASRSALSRFQRQHGMVADGHLDGEALEAVRSAAAADGTDAS